MSKLDELMDQLKNAFQSQDNSLTTEQQNLIKDILSEYQQTKIKPISMPTHSVAVTMHGRTKSYDNVIWSSVITKDVLSEEAHRYYYENKEEGFTKFSFDEFFDMLQDEVSSDIEQDEFHWGRIGKLENEVWEDLTEICSEEGR